MGKRNYMLLLSLNKANAESGKRVRDNIKSRIDADAKPLWFDSSHTGVVFTTEMPATDIWGSLFVIPGDAESFSDVLIVQLGGDWAARRDSKYESWMATHLGHPLPSIVRR